MFFATSLKYRGVVIGFCTEEGSFRFKWALFCDDCQCYFGFETVKEAMKWLDVVIGNENGSNVA